MFLRHYKNKLMCTPAYSQQLGQHGQIFHTAGWVHTQSHDFTKLVNELLRW